MRSGSRALVPTFDLRGRDAIAQACAVCGFLFLAVALGGSSASGFTANAVLQIAAIIALAATLGWARSPGRSADERSLLILCGLFALLFVLQSVPLPPALWTALPGRQPIVAGLTALGVPLPWMPLTLAPGKALQSALSLLPPIAMIVMIGAFRRPVARAAVTMLLALFVLSVLIGVAQVAGSDQLYLYEYTNSGSAVGFFANANHFGTLMCLTMPLAAGLVARWRSGGKGEHPASRAVSAAVLLGIVLLALLGMIMTKSIASLLLAMLSIVGSAAIVLSGLPPRVRIGFIGGVVLVVVIAAIVLFANGASDFDATSLGNSELGRRELWHVTERAIGHFGAVGSGFGTFPQLFHLFEDSNGVGLALANHAHNDLLEFTLEGGIPGLLLLGAFLVWFGLRCFAVWVSPRRRDPLAQGASIAALVVMLHSLVDYPLRTAAVATVFGLCLALLARQPDLGSRGDTPAESEPGRHLSA